ncbi:MULTISPECIES: 3-oxoadipate enol-lactonase [unclassified Neorhizobium]|uniref:3-oxoadipate enol-lactonase n=1 Tax=unclassified Neorhizobium TaxID=2629175 RepID=UPI001FF480B8|nr:MULTISPECIES: 3-oxoadipate enol-lactonase [unclassified Neorhizobium]MCJ9673942.1 3-oxoadipate enol-lactonase [Neorhizobium sp. SHOUNA12B]MCJ9745770.1 3-oxoadipate enol-lactonase [Neorhizobium sp. SHOUNA12A]
MQFVHINDIVIHYDIQRAGDGKPVVVFINSLGTDSRIWHHELPKLAEDYTILTYDKRGHGLSGLGNPPYSIADHAADLSGLLDHLQLSQVIVCGLSVGGLIAQSLYATRPDLMKALIFSNTAHKIGTAESWAARIAAVEQNGIGSILDAIMERWFTAPFRKPDNAAYQAYCNMLVRQPTSGYSGTCAAIRDADFTEAAKKIAVPTLCIAGRDDGSTPPELVKSFAGLIPGARYEIIEGAAHIPCVEAPAAHAALIRGFIEQLED